MSPRSFIIRSALKVPLVVGITLFAVGLYQNESSNQAPATARYAGGKSQPSANKPSRAQIATYIVPANYPRYIIIPAISVKARVEALGVDNQGQIAAPSNINDAGWFNQSSKPGQPGTMFIDGHVSSWTADGIFYNLSKLNYADLIIIERGDGKKFTYKVISIKVYPYNNVSMNEVLNSIMPGSDGLNLMTCTGRVIKGTSNFSERLAVFSTLVNSS